MAVKGNTIVAIGPDGALAKLVTYLPLTQTGLDTGQPVGPDMLGYSDRSVQITGTFGVTGSVSVEGSHDGVTYAVLTSPAGTALTFTTAGIRQILEAVPYMRPNCTAGDGTTSLTVSFFIRRGQRGTV